MSKHSNLSHAAALALAVTTAAPAFAQDQAAPDAGAAKAVDAFDPSMLPFTPDSIKMVIEHHQPKIQECYEEMLAQRKKPVQGKLMTSFTITAEGLVKRAKVERKGSEVYDNKMNDCVVAALTSMSFPKPKDSREYPIQYPFNLKAVR